MIVATRVAAVMPTRGDVDLAPALEPLLEFFDVGVWNNADEPEDLSVYGRYAALERIDTPVVLVQDDDVALSREAIQGLLRAYRPGKIVANMPWEFRARYSDSCLLGFGAIFDKDMPAKAFARFRKHAGVVDQRWFRRTCDVVFTTLTPFTLVDLPFEMLPHTRAPNRMYRQPNHSLERQRMLDKCRKIRDAS